MNDRTTAKSDDRGRITLGPEFANQHVSVTIERNIDLENLGVMRAVHFLDANHRGRASLSAGIGRDDAEALFGIDWDTGPVWAQNAYASHDENRALDDYNAMEEASEGAIVAAYYGRRKENIDDSDPYNLDNHLVIGICPPGSIVRPVPVENGGDNPTFVKTLPLVDTIHITREERPELFAGFAQGRSVYNTPSKEDSIRSIYKERFY